MHMFQSSEDMFSHMPFAQASTAKRYYTVSQIKKQAATFGHNFGKCKPTFWDSVQCTMNLKY